MITIIVGNKCNRDCMHCFLHKEYNKKTNLYEYPINFDPLDKNNINRYISIISSNKFRELLIKKHINSISLFSLGDIMMEDKETLSNIFFLVSKLKALYPFIKIKLQTNFIYHITEEMESLLNKVDDIRTSFDIHTRFKSVRDIILWYTNIKHWSKIKPIKLEIVATNKMIDVKRKLIRVLDKLIKNKIIDSFYIYPLTSIGNAKSNNLIPNNTDDLIDLIKDTMELDVKANTIIDALVNKDYFKIYDIFAYPIPVLSLNPDNLIEFLYYKDDKFVIGNNPIYYNINDKCLVCQFYNKCGGFYNTNNIETNCPFNITEENNDFVLYDIALEKYKERMMTNE